MYNYNKQRKYIIKTKAGNTTLSVENAAHKVDVGCRCSEDRWFHFLNKQWSQPLDTKINLYLLTIKGIQHAANLITGISKSCVGSAASLSVWRWNLHSCTWSCAALFLKNSVSRVAQSSARKTSGCRDVKSQPFSAANIKTSDSLFFFSDCGSSSCLNLISSQTYFWVSVETRHVELL